MKKPASFQIATTITHPSAVSGLPSQLRLAKPRGSRNCSSSPYCGVKKNSQIQEETISWRSSNLAPTSSYTTATEFKAGDRVYHQKFGEGIVQRSVRQRDDEEPVALEHQHDASVH